MKFIPKKFRWISSGAIAVAPAFILIACGETGSEEALVPVDIPATLTSAQAYLDELTNLAPLATSNSEKIIWPALPTIPAALAPYYEAPSFSTEATPTPSTAWTNELPTRLPLLAAARHISVRLTPKNNNVGLEALVQPFKAQALAALKVDVTSIASYVPILLSDFKLSGAITAPAFSEPQLSAEVAQFLTFSYRINNEGWGTKAEAVDWFSRWGSETSADKLATFEVRVALKRDFINSAIFSFITGKVDTSNVQGALNFAPQATIEALKTSLANLEVAANPVTAAVKWPTLPSLSSALSNSYDLPRYSTRQYDDPAAALSAPADQWSSAPPDRVALAKSERHLWVRVLAKQGAVDATSFAIDLSKTSKIATAKVDIASLLYYDRFLNTYTVRLDGTHRVYDSPTATLFNLNEGHQDLFTYSKMEYSLASGPWISHDAMVKQIIDDPYNATSAALNTLVWRIVPLDSELALNADTATHKVEVSSYLVYELIKFGDAERAELERLKKLLRDSIIAKPSSTHDRLEYLIAVPSRNNDGTFYNTLGNIIASSSILKQNDKGVTLAFLEWRISPNSPWTSTTLDPILPSSTALLVDERYLELRIVFNANEARQSTEVLDLTDSSLIKTSNIKFGGDALWREANLQISDFKLEGSASAPRLKDVMPARLKTYLSAEYQFRGRWMNDGEFLSAVRANAAALTPSDLASAKVRVRASTIQTAFTEKVSALSVDNAFILASFTEAQVATETTSLKSQVVVDVATSTHNALAWSPFTTSAVLSNNFSVEYNDKATFADEATALASPGANWVAFTSEAGLPQSTQVLIGDRAFWIRLKPLPGVSAPAHAFDAVISSSINQVLVLLDAVPQWTELNKTPDVEIRFDLYNRYQSPKLYRVNYDATFWNYLDYRIRNLLLEIATLEIYVPRNDGQAAVWKTIVQQNNDKQYPLDTSEAGLSQIRLRLAPLANKAKVSSSASLVEYAPRLNKSGIN